MQVKRLLIIVGDQITREALRWVLVGIDARLEIHESDNLQHALGLAPCGYDVLLFDADEPAPAPGWLSLNAGCGHVRLVALSGEGDAAGAAPALQAGGVTLVSKLLRHAGLVQALRQAIGLEAVFPPVPATAGGCGNPDPAHC